MCLWATSTRPNFRIWWILDPGVSTWVEPAPRLDQNLFDPRTSQDSGLGFDPGSNAWVEFWVWGMGSSRFQPRPKHARAMQKIMGRANICHGEILLDPLVAPQGFPLGLFVPMGIMSHGDLYM